MTSIDAAKDIIAKSGNSFHARVARWFQENGWHVLVSPYYMDQSQNKAREIDLIAERSIPIPDYWNQQGGEVIVRLFVECKFITSHSVFWFTDKDMEAAHKLVCKKGGFRANNIYTRKHHYLSTCPTVAKVFATEKASAASPEQEPFYKALNQVLNAFVSMQGRSPISPTPHSSRRVYLEFPVVVCSDFSKLFRTDFFQSTEPSAIDENFQLEVQYAYTDKSNAPKDDYFLIDFVTFHQLKQYCQKVISDSELAADLNAKS